LGYRYLAKCHPPISDISVCKIVDAGFLR